MLIESKCMEALIDLSFVPCISENYSMNFKCLMVCTLILPPYKKHVASIFFQKSNFVKFVQIYRKKYQHPHYQMYMI
jgi:hypothetical protein